MTGIILAGGENRRMNGEIKALLPFAGEKLIQRQIRLMREVCDEIIVVTNTPRLFLSLLDSSIRIISDYIPGMGPLSGMHAGMTLAQHETVWVVGCDMPFISPQAATMMLDRKRSYDAVLPVVKGGIYPLHGVYNKSCVQTIDAMLKKQEPAFSTLTALLNFTELNESDLQKNGIPLDFIIDIDDSNEYTRALQFEESLAKMTSEDNG